MPDVKWIKLSTAMFDDEKIKLIEQLPEADTILVIWIKLLSQAGKTNSSGYIYLSENIPYTDEMLSTVFSRPLSIVRLALKTLRDFGMIEIDEDRYISIANWEKHQNIDGLAKIREQTRKRVAKHRENKKLNEPNQKGNVTVTEGNATEEELELELELEQEKKSTSRSKLKFETHHLKLAELLFSKMKENNPKVKKPNFDNWANTFRLAMEIDDRSGKDIQDIIIMSQKHSFWHRNILSADAVRRNFDKLYLEMNASPRSDAINLDDLRNKVRQEDAGGLIVDEQRADVKHIGSNQNELPKL